LSNFHSKQSRHLILTPLDKFNNTNPTNSKFLLGEWCNDITSDQQENNVHIIDYHWHDREKFEKDYKYIDELVERLLIDLANALNIFHKSDYSLRFWRIIIGPWLITFVPVVWERYAMIQSAIETLGNNFHTSVAPSLDLRPRDFLSFRNMLDSDEWNHLFFSEILRYLIKDRKFHIIDDVNFKKYLQEQFSPNKIKRSLLKRFSIFVISSLEKILFKLMKFSGISKKYLFHNTYFSKSFHIKLLLSLGSFPTFNTYFKEPIKGLKLTNQDLGSFFYFDAQNKFEYFLSDQIISQIPFSYLEGFKLIKLVANKVPDARVILTANAHWYNEIFKVWAAHQVENSSKLIISEHGGAFPIKYNLMNHPEKIADSFICWGSEFHPRHVRLPTNKLTRMVFRKDPSHLANEITLVDFESVRYGYRAVSAPVGPLVKKVFEQNYSIVSALSNFETTSSRIKILPRYLGSWRFEDIYRRDFGNQIISSHPDINSAIENSSLVICSYPQTTFSESMFSGRPTILVFDDHYWQIHQDFISLLDVLKKAKIIFSDPKEAIKHIKEIAANINLWWDDPNVVMARKLFLNDCLTISDKPFFEWKNYLKLINTDTNEKN